MPSFQDNNRVDYLCKTDKRLVLHRVFLHEKDGKTSNAGDAGSKGDHEEEGAQVDESDSQDQAAADLK